MHVYGLDDWLEALFLYLGTAHIKPECGRRSGGGVRIEYLKKLVCGNSLRIRGNRRRRRRRRRRICQSLFEGEKVLISLSFRFSERQQEMNWSGSRL